MDQIDSKRSQDAEQPTAARPHLRNWLWRPWYARAWWAGIAIFWIAAWLYPLFGIHKLPLSATVWMCLAMILHPQAAVLVLGLGYVRALFQRDREDDEASGDWEAEGSFGYGPIRQDRSMVYRAGPADPRSPLSRLNPANSHYVSRIND